MKYGISLVAVAAVMLALTAPAMAVSAPGASTTWTSADNNGSTQTGTEFEGLTGIGLTIDAGAVISLGAMKVEDGDTGTSTLDISGTLNLSQLVNGKDGPMTTTIYDGGLLTIGTLTPDDDPLNTKWSDFGMQDAGSSIIIENGGTFRLWNAPAKWGGTPYTDVDFANIVDSNAATIVGVPDGDYVVYTGVPEPATMSLLAIGGLALIRRKRRA